MNYTFDAQEMMTRLVKYLLLGLVIAIVAAILPSKSISFEEILMLALTAAAVFALLDLVAPSVSASAQQGVGLGFGFKLAGFP